MEERFEEPKVKVKSIQHKGHEVHEGKSKEKEKSLVPFVSFVVNRFL